MENQKVKVLFIGGTGRSGSTLLERILGEVEGFFSVGELGHIWNIKSKNKHLCGCGIPLERCDFWNKILSRTLSSSQDISELVKLQNNVERIRYIPQIIAPRIRSSQYNKNFQKYTSILGRLYQEIQEESGNQVIVDATKDASYAYVLSQIPNIDLHIIHLVRDSRAVAYSWQKKKVNTQIYTETEYMPRFSLLKTAFYWNGTNLLFDFIQDFASSYMRIRYEDLVKDIEITLREITNLVKTNCSSNLNLSNSKISLGIHHAVGGNPSLGNKIVEVKPDIDWMINMSKISKLQITALTSPLLLKYSYLNL